MIDLRSLRYSVIVADHRSFRGAAVAIGSSQSAIGRRIRSLEDSIGGSIFERHSGGIRLTHAGAEFITTSCWILQEIDAAISMAGVAGLGGKRSPHDRV